MVDLTDLVALKEELDAETRLENAGGRKSVYLLSVACVLLIGCLQELQGIRQAVENDD